MKKTNSIYFYRVLFTYLIAFLHYAFLMQYVYDKGYQSGWYIFVEFFFITSGYLLYSNLDRYKERFSSAFNYFKYRYTHIGGTKYVLTFFIAFVIEVILAKEDFYRIMFRLLDSIPELFLFQAIGLNRGGHLLNTTLWFLSAMIISIYVISWFLFNHKALFVNIVAPVAVILGYSYLYRQCGTMDAVSSYFGTFGNVEVIRGFCDMSLGIYAAMLTQKLSEKNRNHVVLKVCGVVLATLVVFFSLVYGRTTADFAFLPMLFFVVVIGFIPRKRVFIDALWEKWSKLTIYVYLIHDIIRRYVMERLFPSLETARDHFLAAIAYFIIITLSAIALKLLSNQTKKLCKWFRHCILKRDIPGSTSV